MAAPPPAGRPLRARRGSPARPVNARAYRGTWLLVAIPLLIAAFSVRDATPLPRAALPPAFDGQAALDRASELSGLYPDRRPGTAGARKAARWMRSQLRLEGLHPRTDRFVATLPGLGKTRLENVSAVAPGRSPQTIVVMAHRDDTGKGPGANDNASGTAALLELARTFATPNPRVVGPTHTLLFLSTDAGAFGGAGADHFVRTSARRARIFGVVNLDALAGRERAALEIAGDTPRSPASALVQTASNRVVEETGDAPRHPRAAAQLVDLAFPFSLYEQAVFVGRGIPALTLTTAGDRPPAPSADTPARLSLKRLSQLGRSAQALVASLDQGLELAQGTSSYVYLGSRTVPGWAVELVLISMLVPFLFAAVDLFARCRRRRIPLAPALASYRSRLLLWLFVVGVFALFAVAGLWGEGPRLPIPPDSEPAGDWPVLALSALGVLAALAWLVSRHRLVPRRPVAPDEELAGQTVALLLLGVVCLVVAAVNPFALIFVLPSAHAWLWLPHVRYEAAWLRGAVWLAGFAGPAILVCSFAFRFHLGLDAPWYLAKLASLGYVPLGLVIAFAAWLAVAAQLAALAAGRYAPYPAKDERPPLGPVRTAIRGLLLAAGAGRTRRRRDDATEAEEATG